MKEKLVIYSNIEVANQDELFKFISKKAQEEKVVIKHQDFLTALYAREKVGTTGLENHIAIPHAISEKVLEQFVFVVCLKKPIKYTTLDGTDVKSIICLAVPKAKESMHLGVLQKVSIMLLDKKNQDILNTGDTTKIDNMFKDVKKEIKNKGSISNKTNLSKKTVTKKNVKKDNGKEIIAEEESEQPAPISLITIRKELKSELASTNDQSCLEKIRNNDEQIANAKKTIVRLRKELHDTNVKTRTKFKGEYTEIKAQVNAQKTLTKNAMSAFNEKDKIVIEKIKKTVTDQTKLRETLGKHFTDTYETKISISEKLSGLVSKKENVLSEYKLNKKNTNVDFQAKLNLQKQQITNPKNYFYKHINKYQLALMILLAIVGLWGIVLGSFGTTINQNFMVLSNDEVNSIFDAIYSSNAAHYKDSYFTWTQLAVQSSHYSISLCSFIFGILSIVLIIPLKFFKVSNVYLENYSKTFFAIGVACLLVVLVLASLSFENIKLYDTAAKFATSKSSQDGLNTQLKAYWDLKDALKTESDFNNINDFNNYKTNIQMLLNNWTGSDQFDDANRIVAIDNIKTAIQATMDLITPQPIITINNDLFIMGANLMIKI